MLDGASFNAPKYNSEDSKEGEKKKDSPPRPDPKEHPIEAMRWDYTYRVSGKLTSDELDSLCVRFREDIKSGARIWNEAAKNWVKKNAD